MRNLIITAIVLSSTSCLAMDDITKAGVYAADRLMCRLYVPQSAVDAALIAGAVQYDIAPSEAKERAVYIAAALQQQVLESGRKEEYCQGRMAR